MSPAGSCETNGTSVQIFQTAGWSVEKVVDGPGTADSRSDWLSKPTEGPSLQPAASLRQISRHLATQASWNIIG